MKKYFLFLTFLFYCGIIYGQQTTSVEQYDSQINLGGGIGIDYGGLGVKLNCLPEKYLVLFVGVGYNLVNAGYNAGISYRFMPSKKTCLYYTLMYGYNAVFKVENYSAFDRVFYGPSTGLGIEIHSKNNRPNFINIELLVPIRLQEYHNYLHDLKNSPFIKIKSEPWPVSLSLGMHFKL